MAKSMNVKKIVVKPSPLNIKNGLAAGQQIIVLPSNLLQQISGGSSTLSQTGSKRISQPAKIIVPASAANLQRQTHSSTNVHRQMSGLKRECEEEDDQPARKRANLDHLTPEEKLMRRKLKNRVAAQNARDKKRVKMDDMEAKMAELEEVNAKLLMENDSLRALNERLMQEREAQQPTTSLYPEMPSSLTPPPSECEGSERSASPAMSSMSSSDCSLVDSRSFESAELINASQQKSQDRGWAGLWTAVMATMAPAAFCLAASAVASSSNPSQPTSLSLNSCSAEEDTKKRQLHQSATVLPLKKRQLQAVAETPPP